MVDFCHRLYTAIAEIKAFRFNMPDNYQHKIFRHSNGKIYTYPPRYPALNGSAGDQGRIQAFFRGRKRYGSPAGYQPEDRGQ